MSGVDLNRAGTPLLEIVSEPDMRSAAEAVAYAKTLHSLVRWIGICDGNMQEGSFRCDANVSVRRPGEPLGTRCEIKNLNSFRFLEKAIEFEVRRQVELIEDGGKVVQETRLFDPDRERDALDALEGGRAGLPLLPRSRPAAARDHARMDRRGAARDARAAARRCAPRYRDATGLSPYAASLLTESREKARFFDDVRRIVGIGAARQQLGARARWRRLLNDRGPRFRGVAGQRARRGGSCCARIAGRHDFGQGRQGRAARDGRWRGRCRRRSSTKRGLKQISDAGALEAAVDQVLAANAKQVEDYRAGKEKAFNSLVGQVMKATQGKANPAQVGEILKRKLG